MRADDSAGQRWQPLTPPTDPAGIPRFLNDELPRAAAAIARAQDGQYELQVAAPAKPRDGMVRYADGANWNPASLGAGLYFYLASAWRQILTAGVGEQAFLLTSGGIVTQLSSKSTGVTLNAQSGQITLHNAALNLDTNVSFTMTNSTILATDLLSMNHVSGGTVNAYLLNAVCAAGSAVIHVRNVTAGSLSEAIVIRFSRIPGAIT